MKRVVFVCLFMLVAMYGLAQDPLPPGVGWHRLVGTSLLGSGVCALDVGTRAVEGCSAEINDWNGGVYDSIHRRLIFGMGGHSGYYGNELYALRLDVGPNGQMTRLNNPTPNPATTPGWSGCQAWTLYDGRPNSVHTYGGLAYVPNRDIFWMHGGAGSPCGYAVYATWKLNLSNLPSLAYPGNTQWTRLAMNSPLLPGRTFGGNGDIGYSTQYDPATDKIYIHTAYEFDSYNFTTDTYTSLSSFNNQSAAYVNSYTSSALDTKRHLYVVIGGGQSKMVDISTGGVGSPHQILSLGSTCSAWVNARSPGVAYDPIADKVIGVTGRSNIVYTLDTATRTCTAQTISGDPVPIPSVDNGTFGRFQYSDFCDCFPLINDPNQDALILRTRIGGTPPPPPPPPDTTPPSAPTGGLVIPPTTVTVTWGPSTDNVGVVGYLVERCSGFGCVNFSQVGTPTGTTFTDIGLAPSTNYSYRIRAVDAVGNASPYSNTISVTTDYQ